MRARQGAPGGCASLGHAGGCPSSLHAGGSSCCGPPLTTCVVSPSAASVAGSSTSGLGGSATAVGGSASGVFEAVQQLSSALGVAVLGTIFFSAFSHHLPPDALQITSWACLAPLAAAFLLVFRLPRPYGASDRPV